MVTLTADEKVLAILNQATELAEIRDAAGNVIGFFAPIALEHAANYANAAAHIDPLKVKQTKEAGNKTYSTQQVLEKLGSLEKT